jgi:hypothetical protein
MGGAVALLPDVSTGAVQEFNQDRSSFVSTVSANLYLTTVSFQYNTTNNFASYTTVSAGTTIGQSQTMYVNVTGLSAGTTYYVRAVGLSAIGTVIGSVVSFTTWSLKTYLKSTAGVYSVSVPSITPLGGTAIAPTIFEMLIYGAGGGANYSGGGSGGYRLDASELSTVTGTQNVTGTVGTGGSGGNGGAGAGAGTAGGATTLTIGSITYTANGGGVANWLTNGGASGAGDNPSRPGGTGNYGYTYFTGTYVQVITGYNQMIVGYQQVLVGYVQVCTAYGKNGECLSTGNDYNQPIYANGDPIYGNNPNSPIYGNDTNQPIYATDFNRYAGGGGGGTDSAGTNATYPDGGGNGGTGGGAYGLNGGNGGRGGGTATNGSNGSVVAGGVVVGTGGAGNFGAGVSGGATFKYYGP